jgi:UDP-3-O-[3-hydroxymyristoyl] glucosamine N-acyltransferase
MTASEIAELLGQSFYGNERTISSAAPLEVATDTQLSYINNAKYLAVLKSTKAGICLVPAGFAEFAPKDTVSFVTADPYRDYAIILARLYPEAMFPRPVVQTVGVSERATIERTAIIGRGAILDPGVVVGAQARIGEFCRIGANAVIGAGVTVGRDCSIGAGVVISHATIGDRVIVHPGAKIGQDGFGFAAGPKGHLKVPQLGSVIIGNDVEIGANATIDRGSVRNTTVEEGTKIDNLVHLAHNVHIGRHCIIAAQTGIAGSTTVEDFVAIGGHAAIAPHLVIGCGAQIAAASGVMHDIPPRERWAGIPARPAKRFFRQYKVLELMATGKR